MLTFWDRVDQNGPEVRPGLGSCWLWTGAKDWDGYGIAPRGSFTRRAHRLALAWSLGRELGPEEQACHHCDTPSCVRPSHLYAGSPATNALDATERGRRPLNIAKGTRSVTLRRMYGDGTLVNWQARKTHCKHGHEFTPDNIYYERGGKSRKCRTCNRERQRKVA